MPSEEENPSRGKISGKWRQCATSTPLYASISGAPSASTRGEVLFLLCRLAEVHRKASKEISRVLMSVFFTLMVQKPCQATTFFCGGGRGRKATHGNTNTTTCMKGLSYVGVVGRKMFENKGSIAGRVPPRYPVPPQTHTYKVQYMAALVTPSSKKI